MITASALPAPPNGPTSDLFHPWMKQIATQFGTRIALAGSRSDTEQKSLLFADLELSSTRLAAGMSKLGLKSGDSIAIWLPNRPIWMLIHFAAIRLGLLTVPINTWCRESEVRHLLTLARCRAIVVDSAFRSIDFLQILKSALEAMSINDEPKLKWVIDAGNAATPAPVGWPVSLVPLSRLDITDSVQIDSTRSPAAIVFSTSGTSSLPKLASHHANALVLHAQAVAQRAGITAGDVVLGVLPPCGAYGHGLLMAALSKGARAILVEEFDLDRLVEIVVQERVTVMAVTEPLMRKLLAHPLATRKTFESLRVVFSAGGTLRSVVERADELGFHVTNVYGSSEILALAAFWEPTRTIAERSTAGGALVSDGMHVRVVDCEGAVVPEGVEGELQFRGPIVTGGYLGNPQATLNSLTPDGWFKSQDLGHIVDAARRVYHFVARLTDALRIKGFLVSPGEIEAMLQSHPAVSAAQVVGIADGLGEEIAAAFVVLHPGSLADADTLRDFSRAKMASYKVPAILQILEEFPMTKSANGDKVIKHQLRDMARAIAR